MKKLFKFLFSLLLLLVTIIVLAVVFAPYLITASFIEKQLNENLLADSPYKVKINGDVAVKFLPSTSAKITGLEVFHNENNNNTQSAQSTQKPQIAEIAKNAEIAEKINISQLHFSFSPLKFLRKQATDLWLEAVVNDVPHKLVLRLSDIPANSHSNSATNAKNMAEQGNNLDKAYAISLDVTEPIKMTLDGEYYFYEPQENLQNIPAEAKYKVKNGKIKLLESDVNFNAEISIVNLADGGDGSSKTSTANSSSPIPYVKASLASSMLDIATINATIKDYFAKITSANNLQNKAGGAVKPKHSSNKGNANPSDKLGDNLRDIGLDFKFLNQFGADVNFNIKKLILPEIQIGNLTGNFSNKIGNQNYKAILDISEVELFASKHSAYAEIFGKDRNQYLVRTKINSLDLAKAYQNFTGKNDVKGRLNFSSNITSNGSNVKDAIGNLHGKAYLNADKLHAKNLKMLNNIQNMFNKIYSLTKIVKDKGKSDGGYGGASVSASFYVKHGIIHNKDLKANLPLSSATGGGVLNLNNMMIDYRLVPSIGINIPINIKGKLPKPEISADMRSILTQDVDKVIKNQFNNLLDAGDSAKDGIKLNSKEILKDAEDGLRNVRDNFKESLKNLKWGE